MKTVKEWFEQLPYGYRERALAAMNNPNLEVERISEAINCGIGWGNTNEGFDFWSNVYEHYLDIEQICNQLPPLPKD